MRASQLFTKTRKQAPADETSKNAQLLIQAGFIHKEMAGVYTILPLGYKVLENIIQIVKEEMDAVGGVQMQTSALQSKEVWEKTNRWSDEVVDNWFKTDLKNGTELGLSFTNEEAFANLMRDFIRSYKDLPVYPYDLKTMFRNETRSKSGMLRGREFYWKALYSFSKDQAEHDTFYEKMKEVYATVFNRLGIGDDTYITFASGGTFSKYSHEFQTLTDVGEDIIYVDEQKNIAVNKEVFTDEVLADIGLDKNSLVERRAIEVGNIFSLAHKFSTPFGLTYTTESGDDVPVFMGSYGIGITRVMGVLAEKLSDDRGLVWPVNIAPVRVYLARLGDSPAVIKAADELYELLQEKHIDVLYDDRDVRPGEKFADADLMGIPYRVVVSDKTLNEGKIELKARTASQVTMLEAPEVLKILTEAK